MKDNNPQGMAHLNCYSVFLVFPECNGTGTGHLSAKNLQSFVGCTSIGGNLKIVMASFSG